MAFKYVFLYTAIILSKPIVGNRNNGVSENNRKARTRLELFRTIAIISAPANKRSENTKPITRNIKLIFLDTLFQKQNSMGFHFLKPAVHL